LLTEGLERALELVPDLFLLENVITAPKAQLQADTEHGKHVRLLRSRMHHAGYKEVSGNFGASRLGFDHAKERFFMLYVFKQSPFYSQLHRLLGLPLAPLLPISSMPSCMAIPDCDVREYNQRALAICNAVVPAVARHAFETLLARALRVQHEVELPPVKERAPIVLDSSYYTQPDSVVLSEAQLALRTSEPIERKVVQSGLLPTALSGLGGASHVLSQSNKKNARTFLRFSNVPEMMEHPERRGGEYRPSLAFWEAQEGFPEDWSDASRQPRAEQHASVMLL
jgi:hypothetical protein